MQKQRLKLDDLQVETFTTSGERPGRRGTVFGRADTWEGTDSWVYDTCETWSQINDETRGWCCTEPLPTVDQCQSVACNTSDEAYPSECCGTVTMDLEAC